MNELRNRTIVVMGGTSGIGLAAARQLAALGGSVVVTGRSQERAEYVRRENPSLKVEIVDASSPQALTTLYQSLGLVDDLVLCVSGAKGAGGFQGLDAAQLREGLKRSSSPSFTQPRLQFHS